MLNDICGTSVPRRRHKMNISRPHIVAKKSIFYLFRKVNSKKKRRNGKYKKEFAEKKFIKGIGRFLLFTILAVAFGILGNMVADNLHVHDSIDPLLPTIFTALMVVSAVLAAYQLAFKVIWPIVLIKVYRIEFYESYIIKRYGVFHKHEVRAILPKIQRCVVDRSFMGRIFNYGHIYVDTVGKWDLTYDDLSGICNPLYIRRYLENHFLTSKEVKAMRQTVFTRDSQTID